LTSTDRRGIPSLVVDANEHQKGGVSMDVVKFDRKWEINTQEDLKKALETLDGNEFIAEMSDDFRCWSSEKAEVKRQRADVIRQAKEKGLWKED
jgi:hypothetical protein